MALDFVRLRTRSVNKTVHGYLIFNLEVDSRDLMIRGGDFYAIWDDENKQWSTSEKTLIRLLDKELKRLAQEQHLGDDVTLDYAWDSESGTIDRFHKFCQKQARDYFQNLDERLVWSNTEPRRENYASHSLPYPLEPGTIDAWDKIVGTLYQPSERKKIEWVIGAIVTGDSARLQKFLVFYGAQGTGKSTIINIIEMLFEGYTASFMAKDLGSANAQFALEAFKNNPLVGIQHDGTLARIEDNTRLNSLVSHEKLLVNAKYSKMYESAFKTFLIMGTNEPVKITNARSGLLRRLIDVEPSGNKLPIREYNRLMKQVKFELGAIAWHCKEVYEEDPEYYDDYVPIRMMGATNDFFNFLISCYPVFKKEDGTTLKAAWESYKTWTDEAKVAYPYPLRIFKEELKDYFETFEETFDSEGGRVKNWYGGFKVDKFKDQLPTDATITKKKRKEPVSDSWIVFEEQHSVFDDICGDCPAQYASEEGTPTRKWDSVRTKLAEVNTHKLHYVKVPLDHIVIDFDIPDEHGNKSLEKNLEAASKFPPTYAELSKSGQGIHLHYFYTGDPEKLCRIYEEHVEVKVFTGLSSLRRMLTKCNNLPIANISSGLPLKGEKAMVNFDGVITEKGLRTTIIRCLNKEIHADTTSNVSMILKVLTDAYNSGIHYDVSDMYNAVLAFASKSTNQADKCLKMVAKMQFRSEEASENTHVSERPRVFFDIESFPNLFMLNWKFAEDDINSFEEFKQRMEEGKLKPVHRMINPSPSEIEELLKYRLAGFNNLGYDNPMVYATLIGYTPLEANKLSNSIIQDHVRPFRESKNISETDVFDFASASNKKSLKKLEIEMGIHHQELGFRWDQPVPEEYWNLVGDYCDNDVRSTEAAFWYLEADWIARQILADLAEMTVNDSTNELTTRIIFGRNRNPQNAFHYRDLSQPVKELDPEIEAFLWEACPEMMKWWSENSDSKLPYFPGYKFEYGKSTYLGQEVGEGGRVYGEPGVRTWTALLDIVSQHPHSLIAECFFGPEFTRRFKEIVDGRVSIKHEAWSEINDMLGGKLTKWIKLVEDGKITSKQLANALKTAINLVYGLTAAKFQNPFKDPRNVDNIVAKRGALFMMTLEQEVKKRGFTVAAVRTDSIKIPNATPDIIKFVMEFGKRYGYTFEHEATYERMCSVNDAVYVARFAMPDECERVYGYAPGDNKKYGGEWTATGKQFQVPYVFKTLFSKEAITFDDLCEVFSVKTSLHLKADDNDPEFVGRVGQFCPIKPGKGGKELLRESLDADGNVKYGAATGTKGYYWLESEVVRALGKEDDIDRSYYDDQVTKAVETISKFGDFEQFVDVEHPYNMIITEEVKKSWRLCPEYQARCRDTSDLESCCFCPYYHVMDQAPDICEKGYDVSDVIPF